MNLCKNLIEFKEQELKLLQKGNAGNSVKYLEWFLKNSEQFNEINARLSAKVSVQVDAKIKECYHNTWKASWNRNYKYYEGYLWSSRVPLPLEHSWLISNGKIIDPTMIIPDYEVEKQLKKYKVKEFKHIDRNFLDDKHEYVGVHIPTKTLNKYVFEHKKTGGFILEYFLSQGQELLVTG